MIIANTATTACSGTPCAHIRRWLRDIGADRITVRDGRGERDYAIEYALCRIGTLTPDLVDINSFALRAVASRRGQTVAILHTPSHLGQPIRWEKIA